MRGRGGFTLLEVLVAVTILGIVAAVVFFVLEASVRSSRVTARESDATQRVRFALDAIESDLRSVHYRDETTYNTYMEALLKQYEQMKLEAEESGDYTRLEAMYGQPQRSPDGERDPNHVGNPYEKGELIDLSFSGKGGASGAELLFTRAAPPRYGTPMPPKGLERVSYRLKGNALVRLQDTIDVPGETLEGELLEKDTEPIEEILAEGVASLEFAFAFWYDNQWYEVDEWDSSQRQLRSSNYLLAKETDPRDRDPEQPAQLEPGAPGWNEYLNTLESEPADGLPSYVRVVLRIAADPKKERAGLRTYTRIIRLPTAQESFARNPSLEEEDSEAERAERDLKYRPVDPGAVWLR
ncbi:MAG: type II secretion system protein GspJ [Candidatus Sumerlaeia bacterium]|nr:type II secretion system protein GspJ [Candidatus Sumerlaeia bacterium]